MPEEAEAQSTAPGPDDEQGVAEARLRVPPWAPEVTFRKRRPDHQSTDPSAATRTTMAWAWQRDPGAAKSRSGSRPAGTGAARFGEARYVGVMVIGACLFAAVGGLIVLAVVGGTQTGHSADATVLPGGYGLGQSQLALAATSASTHATTTTKATPTGSGTRTAAATHSAVSAASAAASPAAAPKASASSAKTQAVTAPTAAATTPAAVAETGTFTGFDSLCLDDWARRTVDGNQIIIESCNGTSAQTWTAEPDGTMQVVGMCMDVPGGSPAAGSLVELWSCDGAATQVWRSGPDDTLVNTSLNLCLDDPGSDASPGTGLDVAACTDGANQQWTFQAG